MLKVCSILLLMISTCLKSEAQEFSVCFDTKDLIQRHQDFKLSPIKAVSDYIYGDALKLYRVMAQEMSFPFQELFAFSKTHQLNEMSYMSALSGDLFRDQDVESNRIYYDRRGRKSKRSRAIRNNPYERLYYLTFGNMREFNEDPRLTEAKGALFFPLKDEDIEAWWGYCDRVSYFHGNAELSERVYALKDGLSYHGEYFTQTDLKYLVAYIGLIDEEYFSSINKGIGYLANRTVPASAHSTPPIVVHSLLGLYQKRARDFSMIIDLSTNKEVWNYYIYGFENEYEYLNIPHELKIPLLNKEIELTQDNLELVKVSTDFIIPDYAREYENNNEVEFSRFKREYYLINNSITKENLFSCYPEGDYPIKSIGLRKYSSMLNKVKKPIPMLEFLSKETKHSKMRRMLYQVLFKGKPL